MTALISFLYVVVGIAIIVVGADKLVEGAASLAKRFNVPDLVIGLTIVSFGTSAPELTVSVTASLKGSTDISIGNVLGSNIFNVFGILGITAIIYPLSVARNTTWIEIPLSLLAALALALAANDVFFDGASTSAITRSEGLMFLMFLAIFMYYTMTIAKNSPQEDNDDIPDEKMPVWKSAVFIVGGLAGLVFGGNVMVEGAVDLARIFGMSEAVIGLTIISIGTSVPELATSIVAALKKNVDIAVGNVVGSNIFNIFLILGVSSVINPLPFKESNNIDVMMTILASVMLFTFVLVGHGRRISRSEGIIFVLVYTVYVSYLIMSI